MFVEDIGIALCIKIRSDYLYPTFLIFVEVSNIVFVCVDSRYDEGVCVLYV